MTRVVKVLSAVVAVGALVAGAGYGWLQWEIGKINRFKTPVPKPSHSASATTNTLQATEDLPEVLRFLVFSTGSAGLEEGDGTRLGIGNGRAAMRDGLTDSIMLLSLRPGIRRVDALSLPRDLWLEDRGHRINESYNRYGVWALVDDVERLTGLRADHVVAVNFAAFADLTDALGGVSLWFDHPARDAKAKLDIPQVGCVKLDGADALAFVRSRHWQTQRDGVWRSDATSSDWGRIERQQSFLRAVAGSLLDWRLPSRVPALLGVARDNLTFDAGLTLTRLVSLATSFGGGPLELAASTYPGRGGVTDSGASVIYPDVDAGLALVAAAEQAAVQPTVTPTPRTSADGVPSTAASVTPSPATSATSTGFTPARDGSGGYRFRSC